MVSDPLQVVHLYGFMLLYTMIFHSSSLCIRPRRHGRKLIFIHMHMCRLTRLVEGGSGRATIGWRRSCSRKRRCCGWWRLSISKIHRLGRRRLLIIRRLLRLMTIIVRGIGIFTGSAIMSGSAAVTAAVAATTATFAALIAAAQAANQASQNA